MSLCGTESHQIYVKRSVAWAGVEVRFDEVNGGDGAMPLEYLISAAVTLIVVVDPIGLAPSFAALTAGLPAAAQRQVAVRAAIIARMILAGTALIGDWLLRQLGISLPAFRIAGGLLLFSIASEMVFGVRVEREFRTAELAVEPD